MAAFSFVVCFRDLGEKKTREMGFIGIEFNKGRTLICSFSVVTFMRNHIFMKLCGVYCFYQSLIKSHCYLFCLKILLYQVLPREVLILRIFL